MRQVFVGGALVIARIAGFIEAQSLSPEYCGFGSHGLGVRCPKWAHPWMLLLVRRFPPTTVALLSVRPAPEVLARG
jgi:hypothetical protein